MAKQFNVKMELIETHTQTFTYPKDKYYYDEYQAKLLDGIQDFLYKKLHRYIDETLDYDDINYIASEIRREGENGCDHNVVDKIYGHTLVSITLKLTNDYNGKYKLTVEVYEGEIEIPGIEDD